MKTVKTTTGVTYNLSMEKEGVNAKIEGLERKEALNTAATVQKAGYTVDLEEITTKSVIVMTDAEYEKYEADRKAEDERIAAEKAAAEKKNK